MVDNPENRNVLANEAVLSQAKEILDRLIAAVDILVDNVPKTDNIEDALEEFDNILLEEGNSSFSDVHMIPCPCRSPTNVPGVVDQSVELNEEDAEYEVDPFFYEMLDGNNNSRELQRQAHNVTFDDGVRGLISLPPNPHPEPTLDPVSEGESDNDIAMLVDDPIISDEVGDNDGEEMQDFGFIEWIEFIDPIISDEVGANDDEEMQDDGFIEWMLLPFSNMMLTDLLLDEENHGSGDHSLDPPLDPPIDE